MPKYTLPELQYDYSALEPHISARIMELHHQKHHAAYVKNANATLEKLDEAAAKGELERLPTLERTLAFNLSGHVLHSIFWRCLTPAGQPQPEGALAAAIDKNFGSLDHLRRQMNETASTVMGSGWAALVWEPIGKRLLTTQIYDHQSNLSQGGVPLMVIDAWEHAYYLQYFNEKAKSFDALWNLWNWRDIGERFDLAQSVELGLSGAAKANADTLLR
jgi:superoxide dismutase, Fe-Mn family